MAGGSLEREGGAGHRGAEGVGAAEAFGSDGDGVGGFGGHCFILVSAVSVRVGARVGGVECERGLRALSWRLPAAIVVGRVGRALNPNEFLSLRHHGRQLAVSRQIRKEAVSAGHEIRH